MEGSKILPRITRTRNLILRGFAGVYLAAFISFYIQAEGELKSILSAARECTLCVFCHLALELQ
jgi:hypothetical protein